MRPKIEIVHVAGKPSGGVQPCQRCGYILAERTDSDAKLYRVGAFLVSDGRSIKTQSSDAKAGQEKCESIPVDDPKPKARWAAA